MMRDTQVSSTFAPLLSMAPQDHPYEGWLKGKTDAVLGGLEVSEFMPRDSMKRVQIVNMTR